MQEERKPISYDDHEALLIQVANANGDVGSINEALQSLRDNYRFTYDDYDRRVNEITELNDKYKKLERQNLDLFMRTTSNDKKEEENEDVEKDSSLEKLNYEDLFREREGG